MASPASNGSASGQHTPTEAKDFLLGYLNGVVQKEGYRGAKKA
jgi:mRNA-decapping enzyme subunit 2